MKKRLLVFNFFIFFILPEIALAARGVVVVLEAPFFSSPSFKARILQYVRKGEVIYLHPSAEREVKKTHPMETSGFYLTLTKDGRDAYVPRKFVNILQEGIIEIQQPRDEEEYDPTDYRLAEPLTPGYPIKQAGKIPPLWESLKVWYDQKNKDL